MCIAILFLLKINLKINSAYYVLSIVPKIVVKNTNISFLIQPPIRGERKTKSKKYVKR